MNPLPPGTDVRILGPLDYDTSLAIQEKERERVLSGGSPGTVFLLEHTPPVITLGRRADESNILADEKTLILKGYRLRHTGRGGDVTVHEPGQAVAYFVVPVAPKTAAPFVKGILGLMGLFLLEEYGIDALYDAKRPGLWARDAKLCAVGVDLTGGVSTHGIAINVSNSMEGFSLVAPCGIAGGTVTSLSVLLGRTVDSAAFMDKFARHLRNSVNER